MKEEAALFHPVWCDWGQPNLAEEHKGVESNWRYPPNEITPVYFSGASCVCVHSGLQVKIWRSRWSVIQAPLSEIYAGNVLDYTVFYNPTEIGPL